MSREIWKFRVDAWGETPMSEGAVLRHVEGVGPELFVWAEVDPAAPLVTRRLCPMTTGMTLPAEAVLYVGSGVVDEGTGRIVLHVFDLGERAR